MSGAVMCLLIPLTIANFVMKGLENEVFASLGLCTWFLKKGM